MNIEQQIQGLKQQIEYLLAELLASKLREKELEIRIAELTNRLSKDSNNSSKPPSTNVRRTQSLRTPSGKKRGGQSGHKGSTLQMSIHPDKIIEHKASHCCNCGKDIHAIGGLEYERRQVFDIPAITIKVEEHRSMQTQCPHCMAKNKGSFPANVMQPVQYGTNIQQLGVYLTTYQLLPYKRSAQLIEDLTGHRPSEATLVKMNADCSASLSPFMEELRTALLKEAVLHADETGFYYAANRKWLHVVSSKNYTCYHVHGKRGSQATKDMDILPHFEGVLMTDYWKSYLDYNCSHVFCHAHHLRDFTFCHEQEKSNWAASMKELLMEMKAVVESHAAQGLQTMDAAQQQSLVKKYELLMAAGFAEHPPPEKQKGKRGAVKKSKTQNLLERFQKHAGDMLHFIRDFSIPFDNNLAEQAVRMMKVKQKISGCFRSEAGAICFATIRSYIETMRKLGYQIADAIKKAVIGCPISIA